MKERRRSRDGLLHSPSHRPLLDGDGRHHAFAEEEAELSQSHLRTTTRTRTRSDSDHTSPPNIRMPSSSSSSSAVRWCGAALRWLLLLGLMVVCVSFVRLQLFDASLSSYPIALLHDLGYRSPELPPSSPYSSSSLFPLQGPGRTLFLYVHSENDAEHLPNLLYFIRKAVRCWHDADYVFIIQRDDAASLNATDLNAEWRRRLPSLPANARYVLHINECMDWGTVGWLLLLPESHPDHVDTSRYRYFFLLNSSVRGPFLPAYLESHMDLDATARCQAGKLMVEGSSPIPTLFPWFFIFLSRLTSAVKLVGCTISCEIDTHIQSYLLAMDYISLQVLWQVDGRIKDKVQPIRVERDFAKWQRLKGGIRAVERTGPAFTCPVDYASATRQGEVGASQAILSAGYNLAVTQRFWQGVDFRLQPELCAPNRWIGNPSALGVPLDRMKGRTEHVALVPWDVVFVKVHRSPHNTHTAHSPHLTHSTRSTRAASHRCTALLTASPLCASLRGQVKQKLHHPHDEITSAIQKWEDLAHRTQVWQRKPRNNRTIVFPH